MIELSKCCSYPIRIVHPFTDDETTRCNNCEAKNPEAIPYYSFSEIKYMSLTEFNSLWGKNYRLPGIGRGGGSN